MVEKTPWWKDSKKILVLILLAGFLMRVALSQSAPLWAGPDEPAHFVFVSHLAENGLLLPAKTIDEALNHPSIWYSTLQQPPLYYLLLAPIFKLVLGMHLYNPLLAMRFFNVLLFVLHIILVFFLSRKVTKDDKLSLLSAAFVTFLPTHMVVTSVVNNGPLAWVLATACLYFAVVCVHKNYDLFYAVLTLLFFSLAVLTKYTTLGLMLPLAFFFFAFVKRSTITVFQKLLLLILPFVLFISPFARNLQMYGSFIPEQVQTVHSLDLYWLIYYVSHLFPGFWVQEYGVAFVPDFRYFFFALFGLASLLPMFGIAAYFSSNKQAVFAVFKNNFHTFLPTWNYILLGLGALSSLAVLTWFNTKFLYPDARLMFEGLSFVAILFMAGSRHFFLRIKQPQLFMPFAIFLLSTMVFFDLVILANIHQTLPQVPWPVP